MADNVNNTEDPPLRTTDGGGHGGSSEPGNGDEERFNDLPDELPHCVVTDVGAGSSGEEDNIERFMNVAVELPPCVFKNKHSLASLKLHCESPSASAGFTGLLHSLDLQRVGFLDSDSLRDFISKCPRLVNLKLEECFFDGFKILGVSSTTLKNLRLVNLDSRNKSLSSCEIKIACSSLVHFKFMMAISAADFTFEETKCLQIADIFLIKPPAREPANVEQCRMVFGKIINGLCSVRVFRLTMPFLLFPYGGDAPDHFSNPFNNLKNLYLYVDINKWLMESMIKLIGCSPTLEFLQVNFCKTKYRSSGCFIPDTAIPCLTNHIKIVEINGFENIEKEVELVRFVIKHGKKLQEMRITSMRGAEISDEIVQYIKELPAISSSSAAVAFHET